MIWKDDHVSKFDLQWLYERRFTAESRQKYLNNHYRPKPLLWSKEQFEMKEFEAAGVLECDEGTYEESSCVTVDDPIFFNVNRFCSKNLLRIRIIFHFLSSFSLFIHQVLHDWLETLAHYGVAMIKNTELIENQVRKVANRINFIRRTSYGEEFAVRADPNATNVAYTSNPLQIHTDLPYYEYVPGVNLLHCIAQTKSSGAFNMLADGFHVAERLRKENPNVFKCLSTTLVNWSDYSADDGNRFENIFRHPVIW